MAKAKRKAAIKLVESRKAMNTLINPGAEISAGIFLHCM